MKRQLIFILLALFMLGAILFVYAHTILLPIKVKEFVQVKAQDYLQRNITIGSIDFQAFKGFTLSDIKIYKENGLDLLFFAEEAKFNIIVAALFKQKALLVPSLYIKGPSLHLIRRPDGSFNVLNIMDEASTRRRGSRTKLIIGKIEIDNGTLDYSDETIETGFFDTYQNIRLKAALGLDRSINFSLDATSEIKENRIELAGKYDMEQKAVSIQSRLNNFPLADYLSLYWEHPDLQVKGLRVSADPLNIEHKGPAWNVLGKIAATDATIRYKGLVFHGPVSLEDLKLQVRDGTVKFSSRVLTDAAMDSADGTTQYSAKIKLDVRSCGYTDERYRCVLDAEVNELSLSAPAGALQCDSMKLGEIDISRFDALVITAKNAQCARSSLQLTDGTKGDSSLSLTGLRLLRSTTGILLDTAIALDNAHLKTIDGRSLTSGLSSPSLNVEIVDGKITAKTSLELTNAFLALNETHSFSGNPKLGLKLEYPIGTEGPLTFKGEVVIADGQLKGFDPLGPVENIRGNISLENDRLSSPSVEFTALNTHFKASGTVDSIKAATGAVNLSSAHFDLSLLNTLFPSAMEKYAITADGVAAVNFNYNGPLRPISKNNMSLNIDLKNANIDLAKLKTRLEKLSGLINYKNDRLSWKDITINFKGENIASSGLLDLTDTPGLSTHIKTSRLDANARLTFDDEIIFVDELKGRFALSSFDATGRIHHSGQGDLSIKGELNLEDVQWLPKPAAERAGALKPVGKLDYSASFDGDLDDWRASRINVDAGGDAIRLLSYPLQQLKLTYRQASGKINSFNLRSSVYGGLFNIDGEGDLAEKQISFNSQTKLQDMDLIEYRKDKNTKNRYLSGKLNGAFNMKGLLLQPNSYRGLGKLEIREAYLGELMPQISPAIFTDGVADFQIMEGKVRTDNARIISKTLDLRAQGWVGFNKEIDFDIVPVLKENQISGADRPKIDPSVLLSKAVSIKMTGTLDHPVKQINTSTAGVLKNTTGVIAEGIGNILGELF